MGMIRIETWGNFPRETFNTCAEEGGHVMALKRAIQFLTDRIGPAVKDDIRLTEQKIIPRRSPMGEDA